MTLAQAENILILVLLVVELVLRGSILAAQSQMGVRSASLESILRKVQLHARNAKVASTITVMATLLVPNAPQASSPMMVTLRALCALRVNSAAVMVVPSVKTVLPEGMPSLRP